MTPHTVTFVAVETAQSFPAGTTIGPVIATLNGSTGVSPVNLDINLTAVFSDVPDGTYSITVQGTDGTGAPLGAAYLTPTFTVSDPAVMVNIPTGGTVTVS